MTPDLPQDETELRRWTISQRAFALRIAALFTITCMFVPLGATFVDGRTIAIALIILVPTYMWALGDFSIRRENRRKVWVLTDQALCIAGSEDNDTALLGVPLARIVRASCWPVWSLVLRLDTKQAITLPLVSAPWQVKTEILAARDATMNG